MIAGLMKCVYGGDLFIWDMTLPTWLAACGEAVCIQMQTWALLKLSGTLKKKLYIAVIKWYNPGLWSGFTKGNNAYFTFYIEAFKTLVTCSMHRISLLVPRVAWSELNTRGCLNFIIFAYKAYQSNSSPFLCSRIAFGLGILIPLVLGYSSSYIINWD